jgi:hypothetical protein
MEKDDLEALAMFKEVKENCGESHSISSADFVTLVGVSKVYLLPLEDRISHHTK